MQFKGIASQGFLFRILILLPLLTATVGGLMSGGCQPADAPSAPVVTTTSVPGRPAASGGTTPVDGGPLLLNSGFEEPGPERVEKEPNPGTKSQINGTIGQTWWDNSDWGPTVARYTLDDSNPHSGKTSQKVEFLKNAEEGKTAFVQLVQRVILKQGQPYTARIYARAIPETELEFGIQNSQEPYVPKMTTRKVGAEWTRISVTFTPNPGGEKYLMVRCKSPGATFWVDDAELVEGTDGTARLTGAKE